MIRSKVGIGADEVIGCEACGTVEYLVEGATHRCEHTVSMAATLNIRRLTPATLAKDQPNT